MLALGLVVPPAVPAMAATQVPTEMQELLSEDGFGVCVPEDHLDDIWIVYAKGGKMGRVPHVCMVGNCEDLPDLATWAAAQQYPEDTDLERDDVQARYAGFVAELCGPEEVADPDPDLDPDAVPEVTMEAPPPAVAQGVPPLFEPVGFTPSGPPGTLPPPQTRPPLEFPRFPPLVPLFPGGGTPTGPGGPGGSSEDPGGPGDTPGGPGNGPGDPGGPGGPTHVIPLPGSAWLLLSALGLGLWLGRRRRMVALRPG